ncbi:TadE/TadG family type IV pilus assembly protein [Pelagibacterium limicola]|uniref:TadE/TadG family type IV pilus assembly protein n=1 Tax=Pelagibacterium limicola TaxID=2791022 RepID=UPI0018AFD1C6|nr:TadE/TadG family type IV pilus assembly protein [Pelagibacterium limicola]
MKYGLSILSAVRTRAAAFALAQAGVAAVEFALLVPILLLVYLGAVDLSQGLDADRKLAQLTHTIGDVSSQMSGRVTRDELTGALALGDTILRPFETGRTTLRIAVARVAQDGTYTFFEPVTREGSAAGCSGDMTLPQAMIDLARGHFIIATEGCYRYTPVVGYAIEADIPLYKRAFHVPRSEGFTYSGQGAGSGQSGSGGGTGNGNCAGNSGGHGQGNNCNNPNQSHGGNGNQNR